MDEAKFVHSFDSQRDLCHIESRNVFRKDLVFDQHGHEITTRQELHQHVQERRVLERCMQFHQPRTVRVR